MGRITHSVPIAGSCAREDFLLPNGQLDMEKVWRVANGIQIGQMVALFYLIMGSVSLVLQTGLIVSFCCYKTARRPPGGLLFMISLCEWTRSITWLSTGVLYYLQDDSYCA